MTAYHLPYGFCVAASTVKIYARQLYCAGLGYELPLLDSPVPHPLPAISTSAISVLFGAFIYLTLNCPLLNLTGHMLHPFNCNLFGVT